MPSALASWGGWRYWALGLLQEQAGDSRQLSWRLSGEKARVRLSLPGDRVGALSELGLLKTTELLTIVIL